MNDPKHLVKFREEGDLFDLLERIHAIHWRLRIRNPATATEKMEWAQLRRELEDMFPPALVRRTDNSYPDPVD